MALKYETRLEIEASERRRWKFFTFLKFTAVFCVLSPCSVPIIWCTKNLTTNKGDISQERFCIQALLGSEGTEKTFDIDPKEKIVACGLDLSNTSFDSNRKTTFLQYRTEWESRGELLGSCSSAVRVTVTRDESGKFKATYGEEGGCSYWRFFP